MSPRTRVMGFFALIGFVAGIIANLSAGWVIEHLAALIPWLLKAQWLIWGFAGAMLAIVVPIIWAHLSSSD